MKCKHCEIDFNPYHQRQLYCKTCNPVSAATGYRERNRERIKMLENRRQRGARVALYMLLGDKCQNCGATDERLLQIHHTNGHTRKASNPTCKLKEYLNEVPMKLLCANCHILADLRDNTGLKRWVSYE